METLPWWRIYACAAAIFALFVIRHLARTPLLNILCLCIGAEIAYGMVQDQLSVRLAFAYFTRAHPPIPDLTDPTLLGIVWGFMGAWWGGLFLGIATGLTATLGPQPPLTAQQLVRPVLGVLLLQATITLWCGLSTFVNGSITEVQLTGSFASVPADEHLWLLTVACGHFGTYTAAIVGGGAACVWIARERARLAHQMQH